MQNKRKSRNIYFFTAKLSIKVPNKIILKIKFPPTFNKKGARIQQKLNRRFAS